MHILVVNDDGPPSNQSSPYVHSLVSTLQSAGHTVSVCLPNVQRSWIGKAHIIGQTLTPSYFRPGTILKDDGVTSERPFNDGKEEWILIDGTPASCVQIGLHHMFKHRDPIDLVLSGPNYGRNTTAVFALSSGTIGGALEGAVNGFKAIALSYAFNSREHEPDVLAAASKVATKLIEKLMAEWPNDVHLYTCNVPLQKGVESAKIVFTEILQNTWASGSSFTELPEGTEDQNPEKEEQRIRRKSDANEASLERSKVSGQRGHVTFKWSPQFADVKKAVEDARRGDGWEVQQGHITVTPLRANFAHVPHYTGEIKLQESAQTLSVRLAKESGTLYAMIDHPEPYVQPLFKKSLEAYAIQPLEFVKSIDEIPDPKANLLQFASYEALSFEHAIENPQTSLICAYVIRKALIRKHYLSNTVATWLVKHPESLLAGHFKPCVHFELDYAEFLDEALVDAWDLNESMERNQNGQDAGRQEWWILKPGMSDGGNGIRLFSSMDELQAVFEEWEGLSEDEADEDDEDDSTKASTPTTDGAMTSQLRHFIAQPYIDPPLLLPSYDNRKFHIRTYAVAVGALRVYVYREMLALFASKSYVPPLRHGESSQVDLSQHLTNTCFQDDSARDDLVFRFWSLHEPQLQAGWQDKLFGQICKITGEIFEAAAKEQMVHFQAIPNAFEVFGVDFLVDARHEVWLLELNAYPDFKQTGAVLQDIVVGGLFEEITKVAINPFFGSPRDEPGTERLCLVRDIDLGRG